MGYKNIPQSHGRVYIDDIVNFMLTLFDAIVEVLYII